MEIDLQKIIKKPSSNLKGINFFRIGIFLLPSVFAISSIFLLLALIINYKNSKENIIKDHWNYPLFIASTLILISALYNFLTYNQLQGMQAQGNNQIIFDLMNWLPFFYIFASFGNYLSNSTLRREFSVLIISGSFPIFFSGFYQYFLYKFNFPDSFFGPYKILKGLIIWYQRPISATGELGITSIFTNPNYLGCWLITIVPFGIALFLEKNNQKYRKPLSLIILISIVLLIVLSRSKAALNLLVLSIPITFNLNLSITILFLIFYLISSGLIIYLANHEYQSFYQIIPEQILNDYSKENLLKDNKREFRINIWLNALQFIKTKPLIGLGAGMFTVLYLIEKDNWVGHTHNLFLELAFNYGIIVALIIFIFMILLIYKSFVVIKNNFSEKPSDLNFINKAWWSATILLLLSQMVDVQYYDGRISLIFWLLLCGLRSIIFEKKEELVR